MNYTCHTGPFSLHPHLSAPFLCIRVCSRQFLAIQLYPCGTPERPKTAHVLHYGVDIQPRKRWEKHFIPLENTMMSLESRVAFPQPMPTPLLSYYLNTNKKGFPWSCVSIVQASGAHRALAGGLYAVAAPLFVALVRYRVVGANGHHIPEGPVLLGEGLVPARPVHQATAGHRRGGSVLPGEPLSGPHRLLGEMAVSTRRLMLGTCEEEMSFSLAVDFIRR